MDDNEVLTATLNSTIQRHARAIQNYEIEIANLTAELVRARVALESAESADAAKSTPKGKTDSAA